MMRIRRSLRTRRSDLDILSKRKHSRRPQLNDNTLFFFHLLVDGLREHLLHCFLHVLTHLGRTANVKHSLLFFQNTGYQIRLFAQ